VRYKLCRVRQGGATELVSEHDSLAEGWRAGQAAVHADGHAYALYTSEGASLGQRTARFGFSRIESSQLTPASLGMVL
jgi:hypothetical protein